MGKNVCPRLLYSQIFRWPQCLKVRHLNDTGNNEPHCWYPYHFEFCVPSPNMQRRFLNVPGPSEPNAMDGHADGLEKELEAANVSNFHSSFPKSTSQFFLIPFAEEDSGFAARDRESTGRRNQEVASQGQSELEFFLVSFR